MTNGDTDVHESRDFVRYIVQPPIAATFGPIEVFISDIAERGIKVRHADPIRIALTLQISFRLPGTTDTFKLASRVVWSHLSDMVGLNGKFLYESGLRIEDDQEKSRLTLERLLDTYSARPEEDSLEKKKAKIEEKIRKREHERKVRVIRQTRQIPSDQQLMIQQARSYLKANPTEAAKWYQRGKFAISAAHKAMPHRDDVLAIWEYLERSVDLETISWVLDRE